MEGALLNNRFMRQTRAGDTLACTLTSPTLWGVRPSAEPLAQGAVQIGGFSPPTDFYGYSLRRRRFGQPEIAQERKTGGDATFEVPAPARSDVMGIPLEVRASRRV